MTTTTRPLDAQKKPSEGRWRSIRMVLSNAMIITRREVRDSFRDWRIVAPIVLLTFVFPFLAQFLGTQFRGFVSSYGETDVIGERTFPFLLMVVGFFPISISLVIALETFVGEKERRSLEPLLSTPLTNTELYIGKTLSAMIPPLISSYGGMTVYLLSLMFGEQMWRPSAMLIVQIVLLTTVQALVMVTGAVVVSSQTTSTRAANLLASFIIIPMALLVQGEALIMFLAPDADSWRGISALWAIAFGMLIVCLLLLRVGNSIFNREELLASTVDQLNLRGVFSKIKRYIVAVDAEGTPATNLLDWYRRSIPYSLKRLRMPIIITVGVFVAAFVAGAIFGSIPRWQLPFEAQSQEQVLGSTDDISGFFGARFQTTETVVFIFSQNSRVLLATLLLSVFSFGVFALVLPPITFAVLGYLFTQMIVAGYNPLTIFAALTPHGFIEIPIIALAAAASLALGGVVTRTPKGSTVGHAWIMQLGDTIKIIIGVIIPGLIIAAILEAYITPEVLILVLGD